MGAPIERISQTANGIAYSVHYYERYMNRNSRNKLLAVDGVQPNRETIASRKYPLASEVFIVTRKEDESSPTPAGKFRGWALSPEGQRVIAESNYVPIGP
jgi:phosphate transport system substrate-binding protein